MGGSCTQTNRNAHKPLNPKQVEEGRGAVEVRLRFGMHRVRRRLEGSAVNPKL